MKSVPNKLRVLHYAQVPCEPFIVEVKDEEQARLIIVTLSNQHLFLYKKNIIPDYSNAILVEMWEENSKGTILTPSKYTASDTFKIIDITEVYYTMFGIKV